MTGTAQPGNRRSKRSRTVLCSTGSGTAALFALRTLLAFLIADGRGLPVSSDPAEGAGPVQAETGAAGRYSVDARGGMGVQVGEGNTQIIYTYNRLTWTDGVAPPPLVSISGVIDSPYRGLGAFEEQDAALFFAGKWPPPSC